MLLSSIAKLYGSYTDTGVTKKFTDAEDSKLFVKGVVASKDFANADGTVTTQVSINFFTKDGNFLPLKLHPQSQLTVGEEVNLESVILTEQSKGTQYRWVADGQKKV